MISDPDQIFFCGVRYAERVRELLATMGAPAAISFFGPALNEYELPPDVTHHEFVEYVTQGDHQAGLETAPRFIEFLTATPEQRVVFLTLYRMGKGIEQ